VTEHPNPASSLISAQDISLSLSGQIVLDHVDIAIAAGEIVTLIGLNGAGKSTLLKVLLGLMRPDSGHVHRQDGLRVGYTPQKLAVDATLPLTVYRFMALAHRVTTQQIDAALADTDVTALAGRQLHSLSGGELQRVLLARALLRAPQLLVLDEPMANVDMNGQADLYRLIAGLREQRGCGVLLVSHDLHLVMAQTDRAICLNRHVCCTGHPNAVANDPAFKRLFGDQVADTLAWYSHYHDHHHGPHGDTGPHQHRHAGHVTTPDGPL
jgi:zinc transport system ATP-binding protein